MKCLISAAILAGALVSCGGGGTSNGGGGGENPNPSGLYQLQETVTASTCPAIPVGKTETTTLSVHVLGPAWEVLFDDVRDSCWATVHGDTIASNGCGGMLEVGQGEVLVSDAGRIEIFGWDMEATFGEGTISGTLDFQDSDPPPSCQFTETFRGPRQ